MESSIRTFRLCLTGQACGHLDRLHLFLYRMQDSLHPIIRIHSPLPHLTPYHRSPATYSLMPTLRVKPILRSHHPNLSKEQHPPSHQLPVEKAPSTLITHTTPHAFLKCTSNVELAENHKTRYTVKPAIHRTTPKLKATSKASQPSVHSRASPALSILPAPDKIRAPIPIQQCPTSRAPPLAFKLTWFGRQAVTGLTVSTICSHPGLGSYKQALMTSIPRHQSDR